MSDVVVVAMEELEVEEMKLEVKKIGEPSLAYLFSMQSQDRSRCAFQHSMLECSQSVMQKFNLMSPVDTVAAARLRIANLRRRIQNRTRCWVP